MFLFIIIFYPRMDLVLKTSRKMKSVFFFITSLQISNNKQYKGESNLLNKEANATQNSLIHTLT